MERQLICHIRSTRIRNSVGMIVSSVILLLVTICGAAESRSDAPADSLDTQAIANLRQFADKLNDAARQLQGVQLRSQAVSPGARKSIEYREGLSASNMALARLRLILAERALALAALDPNAAELADRRLDIARNELMLLQLIRDTPREDSEYLQNLQKVLKEFREKELESARQESGTLSYALSRMGIVDSPALGYTSPPGAEKQDQGQVTQSTGQTAGGGRPPMAGFLSFPGHLLSPPHGR